MAPSASRGEAAPTPRSASYPPGANGSCAGSSAGAARPWRSQRTRPRRAHRKPALPAPGSAREALVPSRWCRNGSRGERRPPPRVARLWVRRPPRRGPPPGRRSSSHALALEAWATAGDAALLATRAAGGLAAALPAATATAAATCAASAPSAVSAAVALAAAAVAAPAARQLIA